MQTFGGPWTKQKLDLLREYLTRYNQVLQNQNLKRWYVDGFAGSGHTVAGKEGEVLNGSPLIALECVPPFHQLRFIEAKKSNIDSLAELVNQSEDFRKRSQLVHGDANTELVAYCKEMRYDWRAVVFLDPFATAVEWRTMEALAATKKCDVWILLPLGALNRLLTNDSERDPTWNARLTQMFGTDQWERAFYRPGTLDLFSDQATLQKDADAQSIASFYRERLATIFEGGVSRHWKTLTNSKNSAMFALMFALGNPSPNARGAALRIANHLLDRV